MRYGASLTLLGMVLLGCGGDSGGPGPGGDQLVLEVLPADTSITVFGTATYTLVALNGGGDTVPAPAVIWTSSDSGVASITQDGVATGKAAGITNIVATAPEVVQHTGPARGHCGFGGLLRDCHGDGLRRRRGLGLQSGGPGDPRRGLLHYGGRQR